LQKALDLSFDRLLMMMMMEELGEEAGGPTGRGEVARGGCLFAWYFNVTSLPVVTEAERSTRLDTRTNGGGEKY